MATSPRPFLCTLPRPRILGRNDLVPLTEATTWSHNLEDARVGAIARGIACFRYLLGVPVFERECKDGVLAARKNPRLCSSNSSGIFSFTSKKKSGQCEDFRNFRCDFSADFPLRFSLPPESRKRVLFFRAKRRLGVWIMLRWLFCGEKGVQPTTTQERGEEQRRRRRTC